MTLNKELQQFIEDNIKLLDNNDYVKLYRKCPVSLRSNLLDILKEADISIGAEAEEEIKAKLYGIKDEGYTLTVRAPKDGIFNFGWTANQGVQGGSQIAFKDREKAKQFSRDFGTGGYVSPMQDSMLTKYNWVEVPFMGGSSFYVTQYYFDKYDPEKRKIAKLEKKALDEYTKYLESLRDLIPVKDIKSNLDNYWGIPDYNNVKVNDVTPSISILDNSLRLLIYNTDTTKEDESEILDQIKNLDGREWVIQDSSYYKGNKKVHYLYLKLKDNSEILKKKEEIMDKYGATKLW